MLHNNSTVFSDFAAPLQDLSCGPRGWPNILGERHRSDFKIFWLKIVHFGLVLLLHMIRQFKIHLNFLQNFCVHALAAPCKVCGPPAIAGAAGP